MKTNSKSDPYSKQVVEKLFQIRTVQFLARCLLSLAHHLYTFYLFVLDYASDSQLVRFVTKLRTNEFCEDIHSEVLRLRKVPEHVVLILGPEEPSYVDIVKFILWCLPAGILHFGVYDHKNVLSSWTLYETFCCVAKQHLHKVKWGKSFDDEVRHLSRKRMNGHKWSPEVTVHCLQRSDCLQRVSQTVKDLHENSVNRVELCDLNQLMSRSLGAPDPELAIICGKSFTYYGCCPWNMRITQMQMLKSHVNLTASKFLSILYKYSKCEQRFGK